MMISRRTHFTVRGRPGFINLYPLTRYKACLFLCSFRNSEILEGKSNPPDLWDDDGGGGGLELWVLRRAIRECNRTAMEVSSAQCLISFTLDWINTRSSCAMCVFRLRPFACVAQLLSEVLELLHNDIFRKFLAVLCKTKTYF